MIEFTCLTDRNRNNTQLTERLRNDNNIHSIVPLGKTLMTDKMRLLKRTQWPLIDSLPKAENGRA